MTAERFHELLELWLAGGLDQGEEVELLAVVTADPARRQELLREHRLHLLVGGSVGGADADALGGRVKAVLRQEHPSGTMRTVEGVIARLRRNDEPRPRSFVRTARWLLAAAALLAALAGGWWWTRSDAAVARIVACVGEVAGERNGGRFALGAGVPVQAGDVLITAATGAVHLRFADGSVVDLASGSRCAIASPGGSAVELEHGVLEARVVHQSAQRPFVVTTPAARLTVVGTRFSVVTGADGTRLAVSEGAVRFDDLLTGATTTVAAGHDAEAKPLLRPVGPSGEWTLALDEEFTAPKLDPAKWLVNQGFTRPGGGDLSVHADQALTIRDGCLLITAERKSNEPAPVYTTAALGMVPALARRYGCFEARFQTPKGKGLGVYFRLMPVEGRPWPPEITLYANMSCDRPATGWGVVHAPDAELEKHALDGPDYSDGFHVVTCEWDPAYVRWYVDGTVKATTANHVPAQPLGLDVTVTVGLYGNPPDATTPFPATLAIDYIRVYERKPSVSQSPR